MFNVDTVISSTWDLIVSLIILFLAYYIASNIQKKKEVRFYHYKYYRQALFIKLFAGISFCLLYIFYFNGGDTIYYFNGTRSLTLLGYKNLFAVAKLFIGIRSPQLYGLFDSFTWWPTYYSDPNTWAVCRFMLPFYVLGLGSYWGTSLIMNIFLFIPLWNFYKILVRMYPHQSKQMAIALFLMPSFVFWSSGILKDIWCFTAVIQMYVILYRIFYRKRKILLNILSFMLWSYVLISIRPFMFYTALITTMLWIGLRWLKSIENGIVRQLTLPIVMLTLGGGISLIITQLGSVAEGKYATVNSMMNHAVVIQKDLSRSEAYGENTFDIGSFDASASSMLSKAPVALVAGIFRPFIWESRSIFMILSGLESAFLFVLFIYVFLRSGIIGFFRAIYRDPFLLSCITFTIIFGFFVGLTSANFGALVRYKIPLIPFFTIVLFRVKGILDEKAKD